MVLCEDCKWVSFHSGYDFGYLIKLLTCKRLPEEEDEFFKELKLYFPEYYDIKCAALNCPILIGSNSTLMEIWCRSGCRRGYIRANLVIS